MRMRCDFRLDEQVAVVTGAGRGIGAAIAVAYAQAGADVVLVARTPEQLDAIAPGVVETEGLQDALTDAVRAQVTAATPLHRLASVDDVVAVSLWLPPP